ncbi:DinB family protein [Corynebacterium xerosis]|uniref:DinB family protein n=1 Tax=Corynebacterium xerosis TaxID=1725 RepID=UPI00366EAEDE
MGDSASTGRAMLDILIEQLEWHWTNQLRPRLNGLTDEEYLWEPAAGALAQLDEVYAAWVDALHSLDDAALSRPVGPTEGPWAEHSGGTPIAHIHREIIHHGAEVALLRDLWARRSTL